MIFKSITIDNLFSYHGSKTFNLTHSGESEGNIVVIKGRNGHGKTSFLNSIKLLFGGVTKDLMAGVQRGSSVSQKSFVLGTQDWWGLLNHKASIAGETHCSVSAILLDDDNQEIELTRSWNLQNNDYKDRLIVTTPRKSKIEGEGAQQYLSTILPLDYIPFFFFDAEEVGYLAEANRNQTIEKMEQLLNIRPVDNLRDCLTELRRDLSREALDPQAQTELRKAEHRLDELTLLISELEQEKEYVGIETEESEDKIRQIQQKIRRLRGTGTIESSARLEAEKRQEQDRQAEALSALSAAFEHDAFLCINSQLVQKTIHAAESCASSQSNAASELLTSLKDPLKEIFTTPPYPDSRLTDSQVRFYQKRVLRLLDAYDISPEHDAIFQIDTGRAKRLTHLLAAYQSEQLPSASLGEQLARALRAEKAIIVAEQELQNTSQLSEDNKSQLTQLTYDLEQVQNDLLKKKDRIRELEHDLKNAKRDISPLENKIEASQKKAK